jgi:VIT1/CCC1 family predicted Fe2+/Mn2+ transporter
MNRSFAASAILTGAAFFSVGIVKGLIVKHPVFRSGIQTLLLGSLAASLAFITAFFIHSKV